MAAGTMSKKRKTEPESDESKTIGVRVSTPYAAWVARLASFDRSNIAGLFDRALARYAREIGFDEPPPERIP